MGSRTARIWTGFAGFLFFLGLASAGLGQQVAATGRGIQNAAVAVAGTGDFMIAWNDLDNLDGGVQSTGVYARIFEASGKPKGPAFLVHESRVGDQVRPKAAADERGNFVVVWQGGTFVRGSDVWPGGDGDGRGVFFQRFDRNGKRLGGTIRASRSTGGDQAYPNVAMEADGGFYVVWDHCRQIDFCSSLRVGRFSATGERRGKELDIPVLGGSRAIPSPTIAVKPGGFAVGWTEYEGCYKFQLESFPVVLHFTSSGRQIGEKFRLDDGNCDDGTGWNLAALAASPAAGSSAAFFNGLARNSFQLFGSDGDPAGPRKVIGSRSSCVANQCEYITGAAMDSDGNFAVMWTHELFEHPQPTRYSLQVQFFDPQGRPLGERTEVFASSQVFSPPPAVDFTKDGNLLVVWTDYVTNRFEYRLLFRQIRR